MPEDTRARKGAREKRGVEVAVIPCAYCLGAHNELDFPAFQLQVGSITTVSFV